MMCFWFSSLLCLASLLTTAHAQSLKFATITRAAGCPLTVFRPSNRTEGGQAFLAPAFCIQGNPRSLAAVACVEFDPITYAAFLQVPVTVTSSRLLAEALDVLRPQLQIRTLEFLSLTGARIVGDPQGMELVWETGWETAYLRIACGEEQSCDRIRTEFADRLSDAIETAFELELEFGPLTPQSQPLTLRRRISFANRSLVLPAPQVPSALQATPCTNLQLHKTVKVHGNCSVRVLKRTDKKGHFVIDPMLCNRGNDSVKLKAERSAGVVNLFIDVRSRDVISIVRLALTAESPVSVKFMSIIGAELLTSSSASQWSFELPRLSPDGDRLELRVRCSNASSCELLEWIIQQRPADFWRQIRFSVEAQLEHSCSLRMQKAMAIRTSCKLEVFHPFLYSSITGSLCIRASFVRTMRRRLSTIMCAETCSETPNCQAFSTASGACQLFVFDKCSKDVRDCGCNRKGRVFVKRQPGLDPGKLCPPGYGDARCGVKYDVKIFAGNWKAGRQKCESDSGLVTMADVADKDEMSHVVSLYTSRGVSTVWLGGYQTPGSAEPAGGWHWVGCNAPVNRSLWHPREPNNFENSENAIEIGQWYPMLNDQTESAVKPAALCKCVSPFD